MSFLRGLLGRFTGYKSKNKHPVAHIEGADTIMVDSSVLCCPVCYNVYSTVPYILPCGHTFCGQCVRNIAHSETLAAVKENDVVFPCPMCRVDCSLKSVVRNFLVEDLLRKVEEVPIEEHVLAQLSVANLRLTKQRYEQKCSELEQTNNRLQKEMEDRKKKEMRNYLAISAFILVYIVLTTIHGN